MRERPARDIASRPCDRSTIREVVLDFNNNKAARVGCTADQALAIGTLDEDLVKSWMIQESGGGDAGSLSAWKTDPVQANVPGDWTDSKTDAIWARAQNPAVGRPIQLG